jgi:hypothetical protein
MVDIGTRVQDWATEAADAFLNQKVALNQSIRKIASREGLNREKVARVVEESNKAVWLKMFEKQSDKTFTFPVAELDEILTPAPATSVKVAAPMARIRPAPVMTKEATVTEILTDRSMQGSGPQRARHFYEKSIISAELLREKAASEERKLVAAQTQFCKTAQQMVLQENYTFEELTTAMADYRPKHWRKVAVLMKVAAIHLGRKFKLPEGLEKRAGGMVDPGEHDIVSQISASGMPVEVINGAHKLVVALDTLVDQTTESDKANKNLYGADDTVKYLRKELRNYMATHTHV